MQHSGQSTAKDKLTYLKDYLPPPFLIDSTQLQVDIQEKNTEVKAILEVRRNSTAKKMRDLTLDGCDLVLQDVWLNEKKLGSQDYQITEKSLIIFNVPDNFTLKTTVIIKPQENTKLMGLFKSRNNFSTQCEAQGFRRITYFLDRPDVMSHFTTTIIADRLRYPILLSNGNLIDQGDMEGDRHWVRWNDPSLKPCYLFALVAGDFDHRRDTFITASGSSVDLHLYVEKGFLDQTDHAMQSLKRAMRWDERRFGREYDLNVYMIVAVSDFTMGAMENKGLNIFNTKYILTKPDVATDDDYIGVESVIGHEYFHNWTGNRITCRDWFQITLKEGLTVFRDQEFTADMTSQAVERINVVDQLRSTQFPEDASPMSHPIRPQSYLEINNFYTQTVYRKGAEVIRMIETLLGRDGFRKGMDLYFNRYDGQAVTTEEFVRAMEDASGRNLEQFRLWYDQPGTPHLEVSSQYDKNKQTLQLTVKQFCPETPNYPKKKPFHLPLAMGFLDSSGKPMATQLLGEATAETQTRVLEITQPEQIFQFIQVKEQPILSLLRCFSAPVKLQYPYSDEELVILWLSDEDPFSRWEAGQLFMQNQLLKLAMAHRQKVEMILSPHWITVFESILNHPRIDDYFSSKLLSLPNENYLLQQMEIADVEALHAARRLTKQAIGLALQEQWAVNYKRYQLGPYRYHMADVGARSFKGLCLDYLVHLNHEQHRKIAYLQASESDNMTDTMNALKALNQQDCKERTQALEEFYKRWKDQPLVVNKWLYLQSSASFPETLDVVKSLLNHPAFNIKNPNNVYALMDGFANNPTEFHRADGAGYDFVAEQVLALDPINPQVAARVARYLTRWKNLDAKREEQITESIKKIADSKTLSKDVLEIVRKSL